MPAPEAFVKHGEPQRVAAEAAGLRWLADAHAVRVVGILSADGTALVLERVASRPPGPAEVEQFGRDLGDLHAAGADAFGAPWPGFIGPLAMPNEGPASFVDFYLECRVLPFVGAAVDRGALTGDEARLVVAACRAVDVPTEPPSRIHGDLWNGNVLWPGGACLIDPAAHGGHRETDLAMLALFGAPHLDRLLAAYDEHRPLADGWRDRVAYHQLHPLLVHAVLFGRSYGVAAADAARSLLAGRR